MLNFNLVSPERELASRQVEYVVLPAAEGDMAVYENHSPVMTTLRPGLIEVAGGESYVVFGGFADVNPSGLTVLAEEAVAKDAVDHGALDTMISETETRIAEAPNDDARAIAEERLGNLRQLKVQLG